MGVMCSVEECWGCLFLSGAQAVRLFQQQFAISFVNYHILRFMETLTFWRRTVPKKHLLQFGVVSFRVSGLTRSCIAWSV